MNDDGLAYSKYCETQKFDAEHFLEKYSNLIKWVDNGKILDIGCAEGTVSLKALLPKIPPNFHKLTLADISPKLLNFARRRINDARIDFWEMDITEKIPKELQENFDHIFTFYCLNHVQEKRVPQAMKNIFDLLKPGGRVLMSVIVTSPLYYIFTNMVRKKQMPSDMLNFEKIISPYHDCNTPDDKLRHFLESTGFDVLICKYEERTWTFDSWEKFLGNALSIIPFSKISSELEQNRFVEDFVMEAKELNLIQVEEDNGVEKIHMTYSILVACASRPKGI